MSEQNKQTVIKFLEAMGSSDAPAAATCLAPDATTLAKGFSKFAGVRHYDRILATIEGFKHLVPSGLSCIIRSVTAEGERVAVEFDGNATLLNGERYCNQYAMVFTLHHGKIKHVNEYFCTKLADDVLYPVVAALEQKLEAQKRG